MVPDSMARLMVRNQHSRKGALAHCRSTGYMGAPLCSDKSHPILRQLCSCPTKDPNLVHLLRCLFFFLAHHNVSYRVFHVAGKNNCAADALSHNELWIYSHLFPQAPKSPCHVPSLLLSLLLDDTITWTSDRWRDSFRACTQKA